MKEIIRDYFKESIETKKSFLDSNVDKIEEVAKKLIDTFKDKKKLIVFGNGGSASDSEHIAAEFVGRFRKERDALAAVSLSSNNALITALANDYGYKVVFKRQLEALYNPGDVVIAISTSGNSSNVIEALKFLKEKSGYAVSFTGGDGGQMKDLSNVSFVVPSKNTSTIQEIHITLAHLLALLVEDSLF